MSEVKASMVLYNDIKEHGGIPVMWKPGHANQQFKMIEDNIKISGETSGHICYEENFYHDDAMYVAIRLMNFLSSSDKKLSEIVAEFPKTYSTSEIRVEVGDDKKFQIVQEITERLKQEGKKFIDVDGVRVELEDGWWLARVSNTQPDITTRCESLSKEGLEKCKEDLKKQINLSGFDIKFE